MKLNYDLYIGENPNPKDTNNIVIEGTIENNKLKSINSATLNGESLINGGGGDDPDTIPTIFINKGVVVNPSIGDDPIRLIEAFSQNGDIVVNALNNFMRSELFVVPAEVGATSTFITTFIQEGGNISVVLRLEYQPFGWMVTTITINYSSFAPVDLLLVGTSHITEDTQVQKQ